MDGLDDLAGRKKEGARPDSFLSHLLLPGAFFLRARIAGRPVRPVPAGPGIVARHLSQRGLFGALVPDRAGLRDLLALSRHVVSPPLPSWLIRAHHSTRSVLSAIFAACKVDLVVTRNTRDFAASPVKAMDPNAFVELFKPEGYSYKQVDV